MWPFKAKKDISQAQTLPPVFKTIEQLSYASFMTCIVEQKYDELVASGEATPEDLHREWMGILSQYYTLIGSKEAVSYVKRVAKLEAINTKIIQVESIVLTLSELYSEELCDCLRMWGYKLPFRPETMEADLKRVVTELGNDKLKLEMQRQEYERKESAKRGTGGEPTKEQYMKQLYAIEEHRKISYDADTLSLYKFCLLYNALVDYVNQTKTK